MSGSDHPPASPRQSLAIPLSSSPASAGSFRGRPRDTSVPRDYATARLASPIHTQVPGVTTPARHSSPSGSATPGSGGGSSTLGPGVSALAAALANSIGSSPPRHGTPPVRAASPALSGPRGRASSATPSNYGSFDSRSRYLQPTSGNGAFEDPDIVKRHLVQPSDTPNYADEKGSRTGTDAGGKGKQPEMVGVGLHADEFSSLKLQGGDITRPIYKWTEEATNRLQRSQSFSVLRPEPENEVLDISTIRVPGGFRRNFLRRAAAEDQSVYPGYVEDGYATGSAAQRQEPFTSSFLEFLSLYGHFAGEELEEDDEDLRPGEYFGSGDDEDAFDSDEGSDDDREPMEDSTLLTPSTRKRRRKSRGGSGKATPMGAFAVLLKSFVGTGVLFLPRAYLNGGMVFSNLVLLFVAALSYYCFVLLVTTRLKVEGSFGDMGGILYGRWFRTLILFSIVISQIGFVAAYIVFTSENLRAVILAVSNCKTALDLKWLIVLQMVIFLPFSLLRDISKLGVTALIADAFIIVGLAYLFYYDILTLNTNGLADITLFNQRDWTLFIGTAIFTFEGIGLIIPIQESMRHPEKFPRVLFLVMIIITALFTVMGAVSYAAYGSKTETVVLLNLPQDDKLVNTAQFLYSLAILLSTPLQIFPAIRIMENGLFTRSGKYNPYIKWQKNFFRFFVVMVCAVIAWGGADDLDKFVALVGNFACIPLVYIYPPMLHYKAVARNRAWKIADIALCIFGLIAMAYTTSLTVMSWAGGSAAPPLPGFCDSKSL